MAEISYRESEIYAKIFSEIVFQAFFFFLLVHYTN